MATAKLSLFKTVPAPSQPGSPCLIAYANGDWEFVPTAEIEHMSDYVAYSHVADVLNELFWHLGEDDEVDVVDDEAIIAFDVEVESGKFAILISNTLRPNDNIIDAGTVEYAQTNIKEDTGHVFNFIPVEDFFEELIRYLRFSLNDLFSYEDIDTSLDDEFAGEDD